MTARATSLPKAPFGTVFAPIMASTTFDESGFGAIRLHEVELRPSPGPTCSTTPAPASKAQGHRGRNGRRGFFVSMRMSPDAQSASLLCLPVRTRIWSRDGREGGGRGRQEIPEPPGSLYLRPTQIGTEVNIGPPDPREERNPLRVARRSATISRWAAALRILIEDEPAFHAGFGLAKAGANYVSLEDRGAARRDIRRSGSLAPDGLVEETGRRNFLLIATTSWSRLRCRTPISTASPATRRFGWRPGSAIESRNDRCRRGSPGLGGGGGSVWNRRRVVGRWNLHPQRRRNHHQ